MAFNLTPNKVLRVGNAIISSQQFTIAAWVRPTTSADQMIVAI